MIGILESSEKIVRSGLVLHLDAAKLRSYSGTGTTWYDLVGSNNATLINTPTYLTDNGGLLDFDGTNEYATFNGAVGNFAVGSVECWVKLDAPTNGVGQQIVARTNTSTGTFNLLKNSSNLFAFNMRVAGDVQYSCVSNSTATTDWTHLVGTYDGTTQKLWINGVEQTATNSISSTLRTGGTYAQAIAAQTDGSAFTNGRIPIVRLYNRALSSTEVSQNFNALRGRFGV